MNKRSPVSGCPPKLDYHEFLTTGNELPDGCDLSEGAGDSESVPVEGSPVIKLQEDPISSTVKSFQLLCSNQSSEEGMKEVKMIPCVSPLEESGVVQFKDTLSEQDH